MAKKLIYGLDDNPPFPITILAGVQHVGAYRNNKRIFSLLWVCEIS